MKTCWNCQTEYEGNFCPECGAANVEEKTCPNCGITVKGNAKFCTGCGYRFAAAADQIAPKEKSGFFQKGKPILQKTGAFFKKVGAWLKKHIIPVVAVALAVIAIIVAVSILTNKFRAGRVDNLSVGDTKERVVKVLGEADVEEEFEWYWYEDDYMDLYDEVQDLMLQMETVQTEKQLEVLITKLADIEAEISENTYKGICVRFDGNEMVEEIIFDKQFNEFATKVSKEVKKIEADVLIIEGVGGADGAVAKIYYQDGSYRSKYYDFSSILFEGNEVTAATMTEAGEYTFACSDEWGEYTWTQKVKSYAVDDFTHKTDVLLETNIPGVRVCVTYRGTLSSPYLILSDGGSHRHSNVEYEFDDVEPLPLVIPFGCRVISAYGLGQDFCSAHIPDSVMLIEEDAFSGMPLTSIRIGKGVVSIGRNAFASSGSVEDEANWENGALYIGQYLIDVKSSTEELAVREGTRVIADGVFDGGEVSNISIPASVINVGTAPFAQCQATVQIAEENPVYEMEDGVLYANGKQTLVYYPSWKEDATFTVPDGVKKIEACAFYNCSNLWEITLPNGVEEIGARAFAFCNSLTSFTIPEAVTKFGGELTFRYNDNGSDEVFQGCDRLKEIYNLSPHVDVRASNDVRDAVDLIAKWDMIRETYIFYTRAAFVHTSLDEPSVISVDENGFVTVPTEGWRTLFSAGEKRDVDCEVPSGDVLIAYRGTQTNLVVPENVVAIADGALRGNKEITSVTVGANVAYVGENAFEKCTSLTDVFVDAECVGEGAFSDCQSVVRLEIGENVKYMLRGAFSDVSPYISDAVEAIVILGGGIQLIDAYALGAAGWHWKTVYFTGTEEEWNEIEKVDGWDSSMGANGEYTVVYNYVEE